MLGYSLGLGSSLAQGRSAFCPGEAWSKQGGQGPKPSSQQCYAYSARLSTILRLERLGEPVTWVFWQELFGTDTIHHTHARKSWHFLLIVGD